MIKLNRTTEYGLMALRHMSRKHCSDPQGLTSAREVADCYGLPFEITAKTLQRLKDAGLIQSAHGARGGYQLKRSLSEVSLAEFLQLMEGPQMVVACAGSSESHSDEDTDGATPDRSCEYGGRCEIKHWMTRLNQKVFHFLDEISLADLAKDGSRSIGPVASLVTVNP